MIDLKLLQWLDELGITDNPFNSKFLDAATDSCLSGYLVNYGSFSAIRQDQSSFVFAPVGGGKTAFRVHLAHSCRHRENGKRIFPVLFKMPKPSLLSASQLEKSSLPVSLLGRKVTDLNLATLRAASFLEDRNGSTHSDLSLAELQLLIEPFLHGLNRSLALELFLTLMYRPETYLGLNRNDRRDVCVNLYTNFPGDLNSYINQLEKKGELAPYIEFYDPSAKNLLNKPDADRIRVLCVNIRQDLKQVNQRAVEFSRFSALERFNHLVELIKGKLAYESIYILFDDIDTYVEAILQDASSFVQLLAPILHHTASWADRKIYLKYFLPIEFLDKVNFAEVLAFASVIEMKWVRLKWTAETLNQLLGDRLHFFSDGRYSSLDQLCVTEFRGIQMQLIEEVKPLPREVLTVAERCLYERTWRLEGSDLIEPIDLERAINWYKMDGQFLY